MHDGALTRYHALIARVDAFAEEVAAANRSDIACRPGCDDCCRKTFTVFRLEAENMRKGFCLLGAPEKEMVLRKCRKHTAGGSTCVLLDGGRCMLYNHRPVICRTHGLPLRSSHITVNGVGVVSLCEKNFKDPGSIERLPAGQLLELDTLNTMLSALNMLYMKETDLKEDGPNAADRVWIPEIFLG